MRTTYTTLIILATTALLLAGCAAVPETPSEKQLVDESIFTPTKTVEVACCIMEHRTYLHLKPYSDKEIAERFDISLETAPTKSQAGQPTTLDVRIVDKNEDVGGLLGSLREIRAHFVIVSENREEIQHFHVMDLGENWQEMAIDGQYAVPVTLSMGGRYWVNVDFVDRNRPVHVSFPIDVEGPDQPPTRWDTSQKKSQGSYDFIFAVNPTTPQQKRLLNMTLRVEQNGRGVEELEKTNGALAHITLIPSDGAGKIRHLHGGGGEFGHYRFWKTSPNYSGPRIYFNDILTGPGMYRVVLAFQHEGEFREVRFDFNAIPREVGAP